MADEQAAAVSKPEQSKKQAVKDQLESWAVEQDPKKYGQLYKLGELAMKRRFDEFEHDPFIDGLSPTWIEPS